MIELAHVSRSFGSFKAVDDIGFSIRTGEIVGLLGPNGAGKTTTMRMITGFLCADAGTLTIDGRDIRTDEIGAKRKIGYMPESAPLYDDMIVEDYLNYIAAMQNVPAKERVPFLCEACGLSEVMHKNIGELSRGFRQRVGLAHALMNDPEILILDEPTSGLDPNQIGEVRRLIKELGKTRTVIISTHILGEVEMLCDRVIIISHGKIVADSPTTELRSRYTGGADICVVVGGAPQKALVSALEKLPGAEKVSAFDVPYADMGFSSGASVCGARLSVKSGEELRPAVANLAAEKGWQLYELSLERNSLEDVFRTLTTGGEA